MGPILLATGFFCVALILFILLLETLNREEAITLLALILLPFLWASVAFWMAFP